MGYGDPEGEEPLNRLKGGQWGIQQPLKDRFGALVTGALHGKHVHWTYTEGPGPSLAGKTT